MTLIEIVANNFGTGFIAGTGEETKSVTKSTRTGEKAVRDMAKKIALEAPELKDLTPEQMESVAKLVIAKRLAKQLDKKVTSFLIDLQKEKEIFLKAKTSYHSQRTYSNAINKLFDYCGSHNIEPLELTPMQADNFLYDLSSRNSASVARLAGSVASAFYSFLERRHTDFKNPFRGTKARPKDRKAKTLAIPSTKELATILNEMPSPYSLAIAIMAETGLRVGAFASLRKIGYRWHVESKGKTYSFAMPKHLEPELDKPTNLEVLQRPTLQKMLVHYLTKLHNAGKTQSLYSPHDFRHFFAVREYERTKDIYRVQRLLNHSSLAITERYLKGIGQI